jgi:peptide/nickel transport system permease protein
MPSALQRFFDGDVWHSFRTSPVAMAAAAVALLCVFCGALFAHWVAPHNPFDLASLELGDARLPPAWSRPKANPSYLLGTDDQGRDVLSALMYGARISLLVGLASVAVSVVVGVGLGLLSGFVGGRVDALIMRICDVMLSFPSILIALLIDGVGRALFPNAHDTLAFAVLILAIALPGWVPYARTVRGSTMVERNKEYVQAARVIGVASGASCCATCCPTCWGRCWCCRRSRWPRPS